MQRLISALLLMIFMARILSGCTLQGCNGKTLPQFQQYPAKLYQGTIHKPILRTHIDRMYRTAIREAVHKGINFAGHYVVAAWGCGTGCIQFVISDAETGDIYDPPFTQIDFHYPHAAHKIPKWENFDPEGRWWCHGDFLNHNARSRLLVIEGCLSNTQCGRTFFVMTSGGLKQMHFAPDLLPDGTIAPP